MTISLVLEEEFTALPLITFERKPEPKPLPQIPSLKLSVTVEEEYTEEPLIPMEVEEAKPFGDLSLDEFQLKENLSSISRRRRRLSQEVASTTAMSKKRSLKEKLCLKCAETLSGMYIKILLKASAHYLCRFCNEVEMAEELYNQYVGWVSDQFSPKEKNMKPLKRTQKHRIPSQKVWQEAYTTDMHSQNKGRSSLRKLERSLDKWRHN